MCEEWWMRRRAERVEESRKLWDDFERTRPSTEPEVSDDDLEVAREERDEAPVAER